MEIEDIPAVLALQEELKFQDWNERQFSSEIKASYAYCAVFENDSVSPSETSETHTIQGYVVFHLLGPDSELLSIAVNPNAQRSGIGTSLLLAGLNQLQISIGDSCFLEVREGNEKARRFYEKHGFKFFGIRKKYYSDGENAALYKLTGNSEN